MLKKKGGARARDCELANLGTAESSGLPYSVRRVDLDVV